MSYLVLARKYRPASFAEIIGQEHVVRTIENAMRLGRVHHAFLFTGARGVGKTTTARALAKALNCLQDPPSLNPCGVCASCKEIALGTSPDVLEIDAASNTGVDSVREIRDNVRYLPSRGRYRLYIIDEVHMLSTAAFNALLKTLEEPPAHVKFIFATTEPHKIPITILSRCQRFDFKKVALAELVAHLQEILKQEGVSLSDDAVTLVAREAQGSVRDALSLLDQVLSFTGGQPDEQSIVQALGLVDRQLVFELCMAIIQRDAEKLLLTVQTVDERGYDLTELVALLVEHWRDLMVVKAAPNATRDLMERSPSELAALRAQAELLSTVDLQRLFMRLVQVAEDVQRSNFVRVSVEMGLLCLLEIAPTPDLQTLLSRLDALAKGSPLSSTAKPVAIAAPPKVATAPVAPPPAVIVPGAVVQTETVAWPMYVERVRKIRPALASVLEHANLMQFGPEGVELGFQRNTFFWDAAVDTDNRALLLQVLQEQFQQAVRLTVSALDSAAGTATLAEQREQAADKAERTAKENALGHPAVQSVVNILGGEVKHVRVLSDERK